MPDVAEYLAADRLYADEPANASPLRTGAVIAIAQAARIVVQFATVVLLARLLTPEAFGAVAVVVAALSMFELFRDLYFASAVVRNTQIAHQELSNLHWATVGVSLLFFFAICVWAVALLTQFAPSPIPPSLVVWLSVSVVISGLSAQHSALLRRQMRLAALAVMEIGATALAASAAVVAALMDWGIWALVLQRLSAAVLVTLLAMMMCGWRPALPRRSVSIRRLAGFGGTRALPSVLDFTGRNLDQILIGCWWGFAPLGLYERATRLFTNSVQNADVPLLALSQPVLHRHVRNPVRFRHAYLRIMQAVCMLCMPAAGALAIAPDWVVHVLFGNRWDAATPVIRWIGVMLLALPALNTASWLFVSERRRDEMVRWSTVDFVVRLLAVLGGLRYGVEGVAASIALATIALRLPLVFWAAGRKGPVRAPDLCEAVLPGAVAAALVAGVLSAIRSLPAGASADPLAGFSIAVAVAAAATLAGFLCLPRGRRTLREIRTLRALLMRQEARP